jgi:uncharacterized membrane protein YfcA
VESIAGVHSMPLLGYLALVMVGGTLGAIGAGGSMLTVPILMYLFKMPFAVAVVYGMVIVGLSAVFAIPTVLGVAVARVAIVPWLYAMVAGDELHRYFVAAFVTLMFLSGIFMWRGREVLHVSSRANHRWFVACLGVFFGLMVGTIGAGGGFLIVPVLVVLLGFSIQDAVPASLFIIAVNSMVGFGLDRQPLFWGDWVNMGRFLAVTLFGMFLGSFGAKHLPTVWLRRYFCVLLWVVAFSIGFYEFVLGV